MDPLSPKQLRELNSAYTSVYPDKDELSEEVAIQNLAENLFDLLKKEDIIPQDTELTEGWKSKLLKLGGAIGIDQAMFDGAFRRAIGYGAKNLRDLTKEVGSDIHRELDKAESGKTSGPTGPTAPTGPTGPTAPTGSTGPTGPTGPTGGPTGPTGGPTGPTGPTGTKDPYTPEVVNDPDRYIYNGQEYRFNNGKLEKVKK